MLITLRSNIFLQVLHNKMSLASIFGAEPLAGSFLSLSLVIRGYRIQYCSLVCALKLQYTNELFYMDTTFVLSYKGNIFVFLYQGAIFGSYLGTFLVTSYISLEYLDSNYMNV